MLEPATYSDMDATAHNSSVSSASSSSDNTTSVAGRSSTFSLDSAATSSSSSPRPHRAGDMAWALIRAAAAPLGPQDFTLVRRVGAGDIGTVYLCRLEAEGDHSCMYAMKVVDKGVLAKKGKLGRTAAEKRILRRLDHPFLPTMFTRGSKLH